MVVGKPHKVAAYCASHIQRHQDLNSLIDELPERDHHLDETKVLKRRRLYHKDVAGRLAQASA